jgi:hypothetical protein
MLAPMTMIKERKAMKIAVTAMMPKWLQHHHHRRSWRERKFHALLEEQQYISNIFHQTVSTRKNETAAMYNLRTPYQTFEESHLPTFRISGTPACRRWHCTEDSFFVHIPFTMLADHAQVRTRSGYTERINLKRFAYFSSIRVATSQSPTIIINVASARMADTKTIAKEHLICAACGFAISGDCDYYTAGFDNNGKQIPIESGTNPLLYHFHEDCFRSIPALKTEQTIVKRLPPDAPPSNNTR